MCVKLIKLQHCKILHEDGKTHEELADILQTSPSRISRLLAKARNEIKSNHAEKLVEL
jgi:transcriptional regulator